jgi:hypothetical protein
LPGRGDAQPLNVRKDAQRLQLPPVAEKRGVAFGRPRVFPFTPGSSLSRFFDQRLDPRDHGGEGVDNGTAPAVVFV